MDPQESELIFISKNIVLTEIAQELLRKLQASKFIREKRDLVCSALRMKKENPENRFKIGD